MALVCDKCSGRIVEGSKFCPHCGDVVDVNDKKSRAIKTSSGSACFEFGYSSSQNYEKAVSICKNIPTYITIGEDKNIQHQVTIPLTEIDLIINIYNLVGGWKSSKMLINGKVCSKKDLTYYGLGCFKTMREAINQANYCYGVFNEAEQNIWGCKRLEMPIYPWGGGWLEYGRMDKDGIWHFDKQRIKNELEMRMSVVDLCPMLDKNRVLKTLEMLPNKIHPKIDKRWNYIYTIDWRGDNYTEKPIGIKPAKQEFSNMIPDDETEKPKWQNTPSRHTTYTKAMEEPKKISGIEYTVEISSKNNNTKTNIKEVKSDTYQTPKNTKIEDIEKRENGMPLWQQILIFIFIIIAALYLI